MSALDEYRKYVDEVRDDYSEYNPAFHIILKADAAIEQLMWMVEETWGQGGMEYGPPDFSEYVADLELRWAERGTK